jgi:hypothetical protein
LDLERDEPFAAEDFALRVGFRADAEAGLAAGLLGFAKGRSPDLIIAQAFYRSLNKKMGGFAHLVIQFLPV